MDKQLSIRFSEELRAWIRKKASKMETSEGAIVRQCVKEKKEREEIKPHPPTEE
jgi:predicted transcriptional regulator